MHNKRRDTDRFDVSRNIHVARCLDHPASKSRGGCRAECIGHQSALLADRPTHPGVRRGIDEEVPVAIDQGHQRLRFRRAHRVQQPHRAAKQDKSRDPIRMACGVGDRGHCGRVVAEKRERLYAGVIHHGVEIAEHRVQAEIMDVTL